MKANSHIAPSTRTLLLLGAVVAIIATVACSTKSRPANSSMITSPAVRPAVLETGAPPAASPAVPVAKVRKVTLGAKPSGSKLIVYRSRDYGVSFLYPWQYAFISAKSIANGDAALRPASDRHDGQFTLARIEVPRGFYSDTNYESGYFTLSLNPTLDQQQCESTLTAGKDGKIETDTINGVEFRWIETDSGGRGHATMLRQYVTFTNGACYELEMGVKTSNDGGLARDVDPDQVLRRLDTILRTVKIIPSPQNTVAAEVETPAPVPATDSQK